MMKANRTSRNQAHTPKSPKGSGDFYGVGVRQPVGKMIRTYMNDSQSAKDVGTAPKALA